MRRPLVPPSRLPSFPPGWADVFGEDDAGVFAEFELREVRFVWRWIPPGRFVMGSPEDEVGRWNNEAPPHRVVLTRGFWMGETPVTQRQWRAITGMDPSHFRGGERPVEQVTWEDAAGFARELEALVPGLGAGLPTEAQWEYACRAGTTGAYNDGSPCTVPEGADPALDPLGWFFANSGDGTHKVRQKRPNAWGLYDVHGNVLEWCQDVFTGYAEGEAVDPRLDEGKPGTSRVLRGGSWGDFARFCRAAYRYGGHSGYRSRVVGFRLAAGLELRAAELLGAERRGEPEG